MHIKFLLDLAERAGWTGAETALALVVVQLGDVSAWWAAPVAFAAAAAKSWVAGHLGRKGTASTLPANLDPASHSGV